MSIPLEPPMKVEKVRLEPEKCPTCGSQSINVLNGVKVCFGCGNTIPRLVIPKTVKSHWIPVYKVETQCYPRNPLKGLMRK
jgi:hypothetical protein